MNFDNTLPLEKAFTLPSEAYLTDFGNDLLHKTWQYIGPTCQLSKQGDYVTQTIDGNPFAFVKDNGFIKGFHNVCRHHAAKILKDTGTCTKFRCPYHGWTYDLDGKLRGTPEFSGVQDFCKEDNSLPRITTATFGPFLFASEQTLSPLEQNLSVLGDTVPKHFVFVERRTYKINCNWKVFVDNFLDGGYHINYVHEDLASSIDYTKYKVIVNHDTVLQTGPMVESEDETIRKTRKGSAVYYWWVFPNTMINVYGSLMDVNVVWPLTDTTCEVIIDFYRDPEMTDEDLIKSSVEVSHQVQVEDVQICESVQQGLRSSSYSQGRYSVDREAGMYRFHQLLTCSR